MSSIKRTSWSGVSLPGKGRDATNDTERYSGSEQRHSDSDDQHNASAYVRDNVWKKYLKWIPDNWTWSKAKPVIRCAIAAWVAAVLFLIPKVEVWMGQASFLILVASFLSPPNDPFIAILEREVIIVLFVALAWAWACLGMYLANLARSNHQPSPPPLTVFTGQYIEAAPSVIFGVFIFFGSTIFLYIKARLGPGPFLFATIFGCIFLDISMTTAALFPFPNYLIGRAVFIPIAFHSCIALISGIIIFPSTVSHQFTTRLQDVLSPLSTSLHSQLGLLALSPTDTSFASKSSSLSASVAQSEGALIPLAASRRLLKTDVIWARFSPEDFVELQKISKRLAVRANGMGVYWSIIDPERERFPTTVPPSSTGTPLESRAPSLHRDQTGNTAEGEKEKPHEHSAASHSYAPSSHSRKSRHRPQYSHPQHASHRILLHSSLLHLALSRNPRSIPHTHNEPVGVFESQKYLKLEATHMTDGNLEDERHNARATALLNECCGDLIAKNREGIDGVVEWLGTVREGRWWLGKQGTGKVCDKRRQRIEELKVQLEAALDMFRNQKRYNVLDPFRHAFDPKYASIPEGGEAEIPPHRYLFHCYVYQYHLTQFSFHLISMLDEIMKLEKSRRRNRLWTPAVSLLKMLSWNDWQASENLEKDDDENPDIIQGMDPNWMDDLGMPRRRDPDALPPRNLFEWLMNHTYQFVRALCSGNSLFAIKAGILTVILCLPTLLKSSAKFAYENRFSWGVFMGQLTLARFRGDTAFGLVSRILSTFFGGIVGMVMWYISCGSGSGSPYGLGAVFAVCFPFFFYARLYWPGPPMTNLIFWVTIMLVVGYSYIDLHIFLPGSPGFGFEVAWRRFVLVAAGVTAAFLFSFFPPSTTIRCYQRNTLATTSTEIGAIYCSILSFANSRHRNEDVQEIGTSLIAIRSKLKRSVILRTNIIYEFSLRGKWPASRYHKILELQLKIAYTLSHLMSIVEHLEPAWSLAFLRRTRFLDSDFQGDVLAVISLISTSLRTGSPLPQITPCPLLDRFMIRHHGLNVIHKESEDDYGLPRNLTIDTLQDEQYLIFCVGVSTAFGIVTALDRLMVATKELVGEQFHIHGVGGGGILEMGRMRTVDSTMRPTEV